MHAGLFQSLVAAFFDSIPHAGFFAGVKEFAGSLRSLRHPALSAQALRMLASRQGDLGLRPREFAHHLRHRFYLSQRFSIRQRMQAVLHHYDFERSRHTDAYQQQVYRGAGLVLWQANSDGAAFCIRLRALSADRWEGDLSVELYTNGVLLWRMGFAYLDASVLSGPDSGPVIFISRNQSLRSAAEMEIFQAHFKQTAPPYFCLAAIAGVAAAHAMTRIAGVTQRAQIAHEQHGSSVSAHSYDVLWQHFQGVECGPHAFAIPVPLSSRPLTDKQARHRARAAARRKAWSAVSDSAAAAITATMKPNDDPTPRADGYRAAPADAPGDAVGRTAKRSSAG